MHILLLDKIYDLHIKYNDICFTAHEKPTVGDTKTSYVALDHLGWLICDGRSLPIADYGILFSVIGYTFGGSGSNFNLPAAAGRVIGISGTGAGLTVRSSGDTTGTETHQLTVPEMPIHNHTGTTDVSGTHTHTSNSSSTLGLMSVTGNNTANSVDNSTGEADLYVAPTALTINSNGAHAHTFTTGNTGSSLAHNNMQPTIFMGNLFIYSGIPPRGI